MGLFLASTPIEAFWDFLSLASRVRDTHLWTAHGLVQCGGQWPLSGPGHGCLGRAYSHCTVTLSCTGCVHSEPLRITGPLRNLRQKEPLQHVSTLSVDEARQAAQAGRSITAKVPDSFMRPSGVGFVASCVALFSRPCSAGPPACPRRARARPCARTAPGWVRVRVRVRAGFKVIGFGLGLG